MSADTDMAWSWELPLELAGDWRGLDVPFLRIDPGVAWLIAEERRRLKPRPLLPWGRYAGN
jgi:hypothetical protein